VADSSEKAPQTTDQPAPKRPYSTPRLETYGDLRKITHRVGLAGLSDHFFFLRTR